MSRDLKTENQSVMQRAGESTPGREKNGYKGSGRRFVPGVGEMKKGGWCESERKQGQTSENLEVL